MNTERRINKADEHVSRLADKCREGLQSLAEESGSMFVDFPSGSCGPAAELVGRVLKEQAGYDGAYVCGVEC